MDNITKLRDSILTAWEERRKELTSEYDLQDFKEQVKQLNNWLATKEAFLNNDDVGDTPRAVETLLRKHQDFETMLKQQLSKVDDLKDVAQKIMNDSNPNTQEVANCLNAIITRKERLLERAKQRKLTLEKSKALQEFLRNLNDVDTWLNQKIQIAADENYREPSNLQSKIQKHATFEAEINASGERIQNVVEEGKELIAADHYAADEICMHSEDLESEWKQLLELSKLKRDRLNEAYQALLFNRSLDEFETWLNDVEIQVRSTDSGKDLATANNLLKKHNALEKDVQQHADNCDSINEAAEHFVNTNHFMCDEIQERAQDVIARYHQLKEPLQIRRDLLESSTMLQQFSRDVDDELQWLADREPLAASRDLGTTLTAVQSLQKKHQALESELSSREPIVASLVARAAHLTRSEHPNADLINSKANELKTHLEQLLDLASIRRLRLQDSFEVQTYYQEAAEVKAWIHDKRPLLATKDVGKDEDSAHSLQRKLEALSIEVRAFQPTVEKLNNKAEKLIEREHFDAININNKKEQIENEFAELRRLVSEREVRLTEAIQYFAFLRECNEVQEWMKDQTNKADSDEYGNDLEHVELLIQAFDTFHASLLNSEPRIDSCIENGNAIIEAKSSYSPDVQQKVNELKLNWQDLVELANARKDALAGAKQVHVYDKTAEEIIAWIQEKESDLAFGGYGEDSEAIELQLRKHQALESEMKAIKDKVDYIERERDRLISEFPDTKEHVDDKREDTILVWDDLQTKAARRKDELQQAEQTQSYFDEYHDLLAWINEMLAKITAPELPQECTEAELVIERHKEYKAEIDGKEQVFKQFYLTGTNFIQKKHFLSNEIDDKINILRHRMELLVNTWNKRNIIYEQNLDVQLFKREANTLENWLIVREGTLKDSKLGDNILQVEELIRKHRDFEEAIKAQEDKFDNLKKKTMVEDAFALQKQQEQLAREMERERLERERLEQRKRQEMQRITDLRRQESRDSRYGDIPEEQRVNGHHLRPQAIPVPPPQVPTTTSIRKTHSMLDKDRARRGSDAAAAVKRAESMKVGQTIKQPKRTPSFNTKRRGSFRARTESLPPVEAEANLERKQLLIPGGKKASNRAWKTSYTVLCGQLLCFFKNKDDFAASKASCPPLNIHNAICTVAEDYLKKKYTLKLIITDGAEFLFACSNEYEMKEWIDKINFRARLPPSQQLLHFDIPKVSSRYSNK